MSGRERDAERARLLVSSGPIPCGTALRWRGCPRCSCGRGPACVPAGFAGPFGGDEVWLHSAQNVGEGRQARRASRIAGISRRRMTEKFPPFSVSVLLTEREVTQWPAALYCLRAVRARPCLLRTREKALAACSPPGGDCHSERHVSGVGAFGVFGFARRVISRLRPFARHVGPRRHGFLDALAVGLPPLRIPFEESNERGRFNQSFSGEAHRFEFAVGEQTVGPAPAAAEDRRGVVDCLKRLVPPGNAACLGSLSP